jgi:hypothetical protein
MPSIKTMGKYIPAILFTLFLVAGLLTYKDYGTHYDEKSQIDIAVVNYRYINQGDPYIFTFRDEYYGPFYELPLLLLFRNLPDPDMVQARHLAIFITFCVGLAAFYFLAKRLTRSTWWALLAGGMLALCPRIFADAFYNSKDIPFLVFFILGFASLVKVYDDLDAGKTTRQVLSAIILSGILSACVVAIRMAGIIIVLFFLLLVLGQAAIKPKHVLRFVWLFAVYLLFAACFLVLFMPVLWHNPAGEFLNALRQSSRYDLWKYDILFEGRQFPANDPVWNYLPVWIGITTPYLPLLSFIPGVLLMAVDGVKFLAGMVKTGWRGWQSGITPEGTAWAGIFMWFAAPVAAVYVFHSVLYDAWRQMFFIYPAMVLIGVYGLRTLYNHYSADSRNPRLIKIIFYAAMTLGLLEPLLFCVQNHPFQNVYFNRFAGDPATIRQRFDVDYWGLSTKQGIDYILNHDPASQIRISAEVPAMRYAEFLLTPEEEHRLEFTEESHADYLVTNYRWHPEDYPYPKYYAVSVSGMEIMTVYCVRATCP